MQQKCIQFLNISRIREINKKFKILSLLENGSPRLILFFFFRIDGLTLFISILLIYHYINSYKSKKIMKNA